MKRFLLMVLAAVLLTLPYIGNVAHAAPEQQNNCLFFTETGGGQGGFSVCDDSQAQFRTAFERWGLQKIGYPISRRYERDGFVTQAFQKAIMQWRSDSNTVVLVNIFDDLHNDNFDETLLRVRQTPNQLPDGWDGEGMTFEQIVAKRQALLEERSALRAAYFSSSDPITFFGLPTSEVEDMGNHYAIRLQRAVLQEWKETVPWVKAGEVTIANGGDIAKELGGLPTAALTPESAPGQGGGTTPAPTAQPQATNAPQPTTAPAATAAPTQPPTTGVSGRILMTSNRDSYDDIYVVNADGTGLTKLTTMGQCYEAHFSPDGKTIVFVHDSDIWKMNADGSGQINLTNTPEQIEDYPVVSPDGSKIAFLFAWQGGFEIYVMDLDGSDKHAVTSRNGDLTPSWSPDGSKIAFTSIRSGSFNIWTVNADGSGLQQVTTFGPERIVLSPVWSPDGSKVAYSTIAANTSWEVWTSGSGGGGATKVRGAIGADPNNSAVLAAWHGNKILISGYAGNWDPYFINADGSGEPVKIPISDKDDKPTDWLP